MTVLNEGVPSLEIRGCHGPEEMQSCVELQKRVWGFSDLECVPARMFVVSEKIGGQVIGAWHGRHLSGFAMALPGIRDGRVYLHSHMLAVDLPYQRQGIGFRLKMAQRDDGLKRGIVWMEWTFDPLQASNAYFNLEKLGAVSRRYLPDHYGASTSKLQAGLPTDRVVADWQWDTPRVRAAAAGERVPRPDSIERIKLPAEIAMWKQSASDMPKAIAAQAGIRAAIQSAFEQGLVISGFEPADSGGGTYLLSPDSAALHPEPQEGTL